MKTKTAILIIALVAGLTLTIKMLFTPITGDTIHAGIIDAFGPINIDRNAQVEFLDSNGQPLIGDDLAALVMVDLGATGDRANATSLQTGTFTANPIRHNLPGDIEVYFLWDGGIDAVRIHGDERGGPGAGDYQLFSEGQLVVTIRSTGKENTLSNPRSSFTDLNINEDFNLYTPDSNVVGVFQIENMGSGSVEIYGQDQNTPMQILTERGTYVISSNRITLRSKSDGGRVLYTPLSFIR